MNVQVQEQKKEYLTAVKQNYERKFCSYVEMQAFQTYSYKRTSACTIANMMNIAMTLLTYYYCKGNLTYAFTKLDIFIIVLILAGGLFIGQFVSMAISPALMKNMKQKSIQSFQRTERCCICTFVCRILNSADRPF